MNYINLVSEFNDTFKKLNSQTPTLDIPEFEKKFIYDFLLEELNEYKQAYENNDLVEVADAFGDIMYVLCAGILAYGLQDKFNEIFQNIQDSNMSKACKDEKEAIETKEFHEKRLGCECYYEKVDNNYIVYRKEDRKVMKSINFFAPSIKNILAK